MATKNDTSMTIRTNSEVKREAQEIFESLGMDMTTAINVFLRSSIQYRGFPFKVKLETPSDELEQALEEVRKMKKDSSYGKSYTDVDEMMRELLE